MNYRNYINKFFISFLVFSSFIIIFNILINPFGVFNIPEINGLNKKKPYTIGRERLFKAYQIKRNKTYDTLFLGSSRVNEAINPDYYNKLTGNVAYNCGLPGATIEEIYNYFNSALSFNQSIKTVVIALDDFSFLTPRKHYKNMAPTLKSKSIEVNDFIDSAISIDTLIKSFLTVKYNVNDKNPVLIKSNGYKIRTDTPGPETFYKIKELNVGIEDEKINSLKNIQRICKQKNIKLILYFNPVHVNLYAIYSKYNLLNAYNELKKQVALIHPVYDFSGVNFITTEKYSNDRKYFYEMLHYKETVGNIIIDRLFNSKQYKDFGILLTTDTLSNHINSQHIKYVDWKKNNENLISKLILEKVNN